MITLDEIYEMEAGLQVIKAVADERMPEAGLYLIDEEPAPSIPREPDDFLATDRTRLRVD